MGLARALTILEYHAVGEVVFLPDRTFAFARHGGGVVVGFGGKTEVKREGLLAEGVDNYGPGGDGRMASTAGSTVRRPQ